MSEELTYPLGRLLRPKEFWGEVAQWGSFVSNGDAGACLYGFDEAGLVQSEAHRQQCIEHLETDCRRAADTNVAAGDDPATQHPMIDALVAYLKVAPIAGQGPDFSEFEATYARTILFSETDEVRDSGGDPLDDNFTVAHLSEEAVATIKEDCRIFLEHASPYLTEENFRPRRSNDSVEERAAYHFWMTRCGSGVGFTDGDWSDEAETALDELSDEFGQQWSHVGDDGRIHLSGGSHPEPKGGSEPAPGI